VPAAWRQALKKAKNGEIAFLDHCWRGERILKVLCADRGRLLAWGRQFGLDERHLHQARLPHFDFRGEHRRRLLRWLQGDAEAAGP